MSDTKSLSGAESRISIEPLAQQWAKKYLQNLLVNTDTQENSTPLSLSEIISVSGRQKTAATIMASLRSISVKAWNKTEDLLAGPIIQHRIDFNVINPWEISQDCFQIYQKALDVYTLSGASRPLDLLTKFVQTDDLISLEDLKLETEQIAPQELARVIGADIGAVRKKYTNIDPRAIGFVSMQFHYTGQMLIESLNSFERSLVGAYFKVIDDHLYMPLQRAYLAAAKHDYNSPTISVVQKLLPVSTEIAQTITKKIVELFPRYETMSGMLSDELVRTSSIRDVEMFQVYLWVCVLEGNVSAIQEELFPLCVMLYPTLQVKWDIVRQMLYLLRFEIQDRLNTQQVNILMPYFQMLSSMFSAELLD
ncbi:hypothetical protein WJM97_06510 [Okeanomitos corallinicola TIOX110]|uniref:Uncharacterized protein n=1 Tax=Okeanomitos corallinicola TIOX110 TaxID=3133117 RepID=A0ABZ2UWR5_9CYAN